MRITARPERQPAKQRADNHDTETAGHHLRVRLPRRQTRRRDQRIEPIPHLAARFRRTLRTNHQYTYLLDSDSDGHDADDPPTHVTNACNSSTRNAADPSVTTVAVSAGSPSITASTAHTTVAVARYTPPGSFNDDFMYQSGHDN